MDHREVRQNPDLQRLRSPAHELLLLCGDRVVATLSQFGRLHAIKAQYGEQLCGPTCSGRWPLHNAVCETWVVFAVTTLKGLEASRLAVRRDRADDFQLFDPTLRKAPVSASGCLRNSHDELRGSESTSEGFCIALTKRRSAGAAYVSYFAGVLSRAHGDAPLALRAIPPNCEQ